MSRTVAGLALLALTSPAAPAQGLAVKVGPQLALASYREVAAGLRYQGTGFGGALSARYRKLSAEASVVRLTLDPASGSAATSGFTATEVDAWVAYDLATYASVEAGFIRRSIWPRRSSRAAAMPGSRSTWGSAWTSGWRDACTARRATRFSGSAGGRTRAGPGRLTRRFRGPWRAWESRWRSRLLPFPS